LPGVAEIEWKTYEVVGTDDERRFGEEMGRVNDYELVRKIELEIVYYRHLSYARKVAWQSSTPTLIEKGGMPTLPACRGPERPSFLFTL